MIVDYEAVSKNGCNSLLLLHTRNKKEIVLSLRLRWVSPMAAEHGWYLI